MNDGQCEEDRRGDEKDRAKHRQPGVQLRLALFDLLRVHLRYGAVLRDRRLFGDQRQTPTAAIVEPGHAAAAVAVAEPAAIAAIGLESPEILCGLGAQGLPRRCTERRRRLANDTGEAQGLLLLRNFDGKPAEPVEVDSHRSQVDPKHRQIQAVLQVVGVDDVEVLAIVSLAADAFRVAVGDLEDNGHRHCARRVLLPRVPRLHDGDVRHRERERPRQVLIVDVGAAGFLRLQPEAVGVPVPNGHLGVDRRLDLRRKDVDVEAL
mmetsp:Transcript_26031/g.75044  ORF Transcript_26031/g.75044 Transcript_26031/m.75044 type:complete len:264 (-) Transcript_26031:408-1199(-)